MADLSYKSTGGPLFVNVSTGGYGKAMTWRSERHCWRPRLCPNTPLKHRVVAVIEVLGPDGTHSYRVRADSGHESMMAPGAAAPPTGSDSGHAASVRACDLRVA
ncbi:MAG TPA: DUF1918 domain-containing protein [Pseudonocardiaceae bacterium]|nr:DUF1918 domain-containing protein [Pseudonocardiaceae bacterium]